MDIISLENYPHYDNRSHFEHIKQPWVFLDLHQRPKNTHLRSLPLGPFGTNPKPRGPVDFTSDFLRVSPTENGDFTIDFTTKLPTYQQYPTIHCMIHCNPLEYFVFSPNMWVALATSLYELQQMASIRYVIWPFSCENSWGLTQNGRDTPTDPTGNQLWDLEFPGSRQDHLKETPMFHISSKSPDSLRLPKIFPKHES